MERKQLWVSIAIILIILSLCLTIMEFRLQALHYKQELLKLENSSSKDTNENFIKAFFQYNSTKQRYEQIKPLMTNEGYHSTFPSGMEIPETDQSVVSKIEFLVSYEHPISKTSSEYISEFKQTTRFRDIENTQTILLKTKLEFENSWKVQKVEFLAQTSYAP
jgi:hypothetical protein